MDRRARLTQRAIQIARGRRAEDESMARGRAKGAMGALGERG